MLSCSCTGNRRFTRNVKHVEIRSCLAKNYRASLWNCAKWKQETNRMHTNGNCEIVCSCCLLVFKSRCTLKFFLIFETFLITLFVSGVDNKISILSTLYLFFFVLCYANVCTITMNDVVTVCMYTLTSTVSQRLPGKYCF